MKLAIRAGVSLERSHLYTACKNGYVEVVKTLIEAGANVLVSGSTIFKCDKYNSIIRDLRSS